MFSKSLLSFVCSTNEERLPILPNLARYADKPGTEGEGFKSDAPSKEFERPDGIRGGCMALLALGVPLDNVDIAGDSRRFSLISG